MQGPRAELAAQLVRSDPNSAIVRTGTIEPMPMPDAPAATVMPTTIATGKSAPAKPRNYSRPVAKR